MKYKITLTADDGTVIAQWDVTVNRAKMADAIYLHNHIAVTCLADEVISEVERADMRAGIAVEGRTK